MFAEDLICLHIGLIVLLRALYDVSLDYRNNPPKLVVISSMGVGGQAFKQLPIL